MTVQELAQIVRRTREARPNDDARFAVELRKVVAESKVRHGSKAWALKPKAPS